MRRRFTEPSCLAAAPAERYLIFGGLEGEPARGPRTVIEAGSIALLSNYGREAIDPPSPRWLGNSADRDAIRLSGLWNVNHVRDMYNPAFLDTMERFVRR